MKLSQPVTQHRLAPYFFTLPFIVVFVAFNLYPLIISFILSFLQWETGSLFALENMSVDLTKNYSIAISEPLLMDALLNSSLITLGAVLCVHCLSLALAKIISHCFQFLQGMLLVLLFSPYVLSETGLAQAYRGVFNFLDGDYSIAFVIFILTIKYVGFFTLVYTMVLRTVTQDIKDAAFLEGASGVRVFLQIEIIAIKAMIFMMALLSFIFFVQSNEVSSLLTVWTNGELNAMTYFSLLLRLVEQHEFSVASALSWLFISLLVLVFVSSYHLYKLVK